MSYNAYILFRYPSTPVLRARTYKSEHKRLPVTRLAEEDQRLGDSHLFVPL